MELTGARWLVTGDTGFIGRRVVSILRSRGAVVKGLSRTAGINLCAESAWRDDVAAFAPDYVVHLAAAGVTGQALPKEMYAVNVFATLSLLQALSELPSPVRVVIAGTGAEYGPQLRLLREDDPLAPSSDYGRTKAEACRFAESFKDRLSMAWLRLFNVYGPGESSHRLLPSLVKSAYAGTPALLSDREAVRDFSYVDDVAEIMIAFALRLPTLPSWMVCNVGSGIASPVGAFVAQASAVLARRGLALDVRFGERSPAAHESVHYAPDVERMGRWLRPMPAPMSWADGIERTADAILGSTSHPTSP